MRLLVVGMAFSSICMALERRIALPLVPQTNGKFLSFERAAEERQIVIEKLPKSEIRLTYPGGRKQVLNVHGSEMVKTMKYFSPNSERFDFTFKQTMLEGRVYINGAGPMPYISIDQQGNGDGFAYLIPSEELTQIAVRDNRQREVSTKLSLPSKKVISCNGRKELKCAPQP